MVFSSITFLFFFLPTVLLLYQLSGKRTRNALLLAASLFFYSWGEGVYVLLMVISIIINYSGGLLIAERRAAAGRRFFLVLSVALNLLILGFFKYAHFITDNLNLVFSYLSLPAIELAPVRLPIGISFFTFQALSYIIDVYRSKELPQKNIINLALYISLFPQLIAGPIVRYNQIADEIENRAATMNDLAEGIQRFLLGLSKKILLANPLAAIADKIFMLPETELTTTLAWLGALCYTLQIYFDFSGYSDMAIGLGRMFGFHFPENFNYPYISTSIRDFWRRWHISLSSWFKDYLYIPLGGSKYGPIRTYTQSSHRFSALRLLAWGKLDLYRLGTLSWLLSCCGAYPSGRDCRQAVATGPYPAHLPAGDVWLGDFQKRHVARSAPLYGSNGWRGAERF